MRLKSEINVPQIYELAKKEIGYKGTLQEYKLIIRDENEKIMLEAFRNPEGCSTPMGRIKIRGFKPSITISDRKESKTLGKEVINFNDHTNGIIFKINLVFYKKSLGKVYFTRKWNRALAKILKSEKYPRYQVFYKK